MLFELKTIKNAIVIGAGHGIGLALVKKILEINSHCRIWTTYRLNEKAQELLVLEQENERVTSFNISPSEESEILSLTQQLNQSLEGIDLVINTVGFLHDDKIKPEKSLRDISANNLSHYFKINSIITPLLAQHFFPFMKKKIYLCWLPSLPR